MLLIPFIYCVSSALWVLASDSYSLKDTFKDFDFFKHWKWETFDDPTHGRVNYVDKAVAIEKNLSFASSEPSKFVMRADPHESVPVYQRGRNSVRISSYSDYTEAVFVLDLSHMPVGCSTWPAFWTLSRMGPWPKGGEIDIIEGVNVNSRNLVSLHTSSNCAMPQYSGLTRPYTGESTSDNCDAAFNYNTGCGIAFNKPNSYGYAFNANGGGYYVLARTVSAIQVWFWPRNAADVPQEILHPGNCTGHLDISEFPKPDAYFATRESCDYASHFDAHYMVFDITFCGDWAGNTFTQAGCGTSCSAFVDTNPQAFEEAYWEINSLQVYTKDIKDVENLGFTAQGYGEAGLY